MSRFLFGPRITNGVVLWLWGLFALVWLMIMLGGATRLTHAGLSIVEWKPFTGIIPPLSLDAWMAEFAKYQQTPEYRLVNSGMSLTDFKFIFWMEFSHRLLGRFIGFYLFFPMLYFWITDQLNGRLKSTCMLLLVLLGAQGFLGWYMVKSGLVDNPAVSPFRLSAHLLTAFLFIAVVLSTIFKSHHMHLSTARSTMWSGINLFLVIMGVFYGALVAGLKAGLIYNTFPLMEGLWVPSEWLALKPLWANFFENHATVQFIHRMLAYSILVSACVGVARQWVSQWYMGVVFVQLCLGVATLLYNVPVLLGTLHQGWAVIVFSSAFWLHLVHRKAETPLYASE